ncbi:uncharacterized protein BKA55DRAFT_546880 [Fusarium redolens]|uniref:SET domain-containing protein n=1 Tax=Fusarium redolens TaxID=48865 RepID=A0A9P9FXL9_FUSRE|nr:uncharacterized protein BKA55DRAFT_546880 [Fusarium redolens]KAH7208454.1 hypothetical protein BKA55DRAFT_546880 [Fusarium redolens]
MKTLQDLVNWAMAEGFILTKVKPYMTNNNKTGFVATGNIKKGDVVLKVPCKSAYTSSDISAEIKDEYPGCEAQSYYALEIAKSIRKKEKNAWCFLDQVPDELLRDSVLTWPDNVIKALPRQTNDLAADVKAMYTGDWTKTKLSQKKKNIDIKEEEFKKAWIVAQTRMLMCRGINEEVIQVMLPLAEMFNHASDGCHMELSEDYYEFRATRNYNTGDEVCWNYNEQYTNDDLLSCYGFIEKNNKKNYFVLDDFILPKLKKLSGAPKNEKERNLITHRESGLSGGITVELNDTAENSLRFLRKQDKSLPGNRQFEDHPLEFDHIAKEFLGELEMKTLEEYSKIEKDIKEYPIIKKRWEEHLMLIKNALKTYSYDE